MSKRIFILCMCILNGFAIRMYAGTFTYSSRLAGSAITSGATLETYDDEYFDMTGAGSIGTTWHSENTNRSVTDYVHLKYTGAANKYYSADWSVQVILQVDRWDEYGTLQTPETCTLKVEYTVAAGTKYTDISSYKNTTTPGNKTKVTVSSISYTGSVSSMPSDVIIESVIDVDRDYFMNAGDAIDIDNTTNTCTFGIGAVNTALTTEFHWDYLEGAEEYDLEWVFKSAYDLDLTVDYSKATRVTTSNQYYVINNAYDEGTIYYRIRAVAKDYTTGTQRLEGEWTTGTNSIVVCNIEKRNWTYNAVYAEEGKRKEVMTYFDGSTRNRQSVTLSNTENVGLVAEDMYDYEGRPTIKTLPAPASDFRNDLRFYQAFSLNGSGGLFTKKNFDTDVNSPCGSGAIGLNSTSGANGASYYYSSYNALSGTGFNAAIPDATDYVSTTTTNDHSYPFSQVVYSTDGTLKMQSGVGPYHKIGSGHETQYLNATPAQEKLDRLFGNEVGYAEHYREKAVIDPNGQVSVSYENLSGKVIATCMRGDAPSSLVALGTGSDVEPYTALEETTQNFATHYDAASESYVNNENFMVTNTASNYNFSYQITPQQFGVVCGQTYKCHYLLHITVKDDCGNNVTEASGISTISSPGALPVLNTMHRINAADYVSTNFTATFRLNFPHVGIYKIEKTLSLDEDSLQAALANYEAVISNPMSTCVTSLTDLDATYEAGVDMTECMDCEQYCDYEAAHLTFPYTDENENTFEDSTAFLTYCKAQCHPDIPAKSCDGLLDALKDDMSPGGQYFESIINVYNDSPIIGGTGPHVYSTPEYYVDALPSVNSSFYTDWASYISANHCNALPGTLDYANLTANWDPCWAGFLVKYHPEYCRYQRCVTLSPSFDFNANVLNTNYIQATTTLPSTGTPYLDISTSTIGTSVLAQDPYFLSINPGDNSTMSAQITACAVCNSNFVSYAPAVALSYSSTTSMWDWALVAPTDISGMSAGPAKNDAHWSNFLKLYLAEKAQLEKLYGCSALTDNTYPPDNLSDYGPAGYAYAETTGAGPINSYYISGKNIDDPEPLNSFQTVLTDLVADATANPSTPNFGIYDDTAGVCYYNNSIATLHITPADPSTFTDPVVPSGVGNCTLTKCATYSVTPASTNTYVFYVNIAQVPFNYPIDNRVDSTWAYGSCYLRISDSVALPGVYTGSSIADITSYLDRIKNAINNYVSTPYDFTCVTHPPTSTGGTYSYSIMASSALGPFGKPSNLKLSIEITSPGGTIVNQCYDPNGSYMGFTTATENCDLPPTFAPSCLCIQLNQMYTFYTSVKDGSGHITINQEDSTHITYNSFEDYALAQLNNGYSITDTIVTATNIDYWWTNCTSDSHPMQSPLVIGTDGTPIVSDDNTANSVPSEIKCGPDEPCQQQGMDEADFFASEEHDALIQQALDDFVVQYKKACLHQGNLNEQFNVDYYEKEYHYTLYYYDQAGNLVRTVPPNAVKRITYANLYSGGVEVVQYARLHANDVTPPPPVYPGHSRVLQYSPLVNNLLVTNYKYNTLNQLVQQETPDGGLSNFWYNDIGQLRFSQNAKQVANTTNNANGQYSYTIYDGQGRINEVGENYQDTTISSTVYPFYTQVNRPFFPSVNGTQVTKTYYDAPVSGGSYTGTFLRKRVAMVSIEDVEDGSDITYNNATYYGYDVHGNVNTLVQDFPDLAASNNSLKTINYKYDLISGNVNEVDYQPGQYDQYYHRYEYDANNRITHVYTSKDNAHWQQDARYFYYLHGPLARTELGDDKVQGLDYTYTIQGWIKSVNTNTFQSHVDLGRDAVKNTSLLSIYDYLLTQSNVHLNVAQDVVGYALDYFTGDYRSVGSNAYTGNNWNTDVDGNMSLSGSTNLYNGNIKAMSTAMYKPVVSGLPAQMPTMAKFFQYDQLNRIKEAQSYGVTANATIGAITPWGTPANSDYYEKFNYDANGNILKAFRNGYTATGIVNNMDDMTYNYVNTTNNNKLDYASDAGDNATPANFGDIKTQSSANYGYDLIGNLNKDVLEGITNIDWTVYGKIKKIYKAAENIEFSYDASGNRVEKIVKPVVSGTEKTQQYWTYTYYMRDAQGNPMAMYSRAMTVNTGTNKVTDQLDLTETPIYGSSRIGIETHNEHAGSTPGVTYNFGGYNSDGTIIDSGSPTSNAYTAPPFDHVMGNKEYELNNHLGNVNVVISDRKLGVYVSGTTVDHYLADVLSSNDYYAFGAPMPGRSYVSSTPYRFGFGGQEKDDEIKGNGNSYTAEFWEYDPRLGRRFNTDPIIKPWFSDYGCFGNNPILFTDPNGDDPDEYTHDNNTGERKKVSNLGGDEVDFIHNGHTITEGENKGAFQQDGETEVRDAINLKGTNAIGDCNFNCHGTPTNRDISNEYYKNVDIQNGQLLQATSYSKDLRQAENGMYVDYTGYQADPMRVSYWIHQQNQIEADEGILKWIDGPGEIEAFESFSAFKRFYGPAGEGRAWHHIVEQTPSNVERFGPKAIHCTENLVNVEHGAASVHSRISAFYSSKQEFTAGKTVREWLKDKDYTEQYEFGLEVLEHFSNNK